MKKIFGLILLLISGSAFAQEDFVAPRTEWGHP